MPRFLSQVSGVKQCAAWTAGPPALDNIHSFWDPCSACVFPGDGFSGIDRLYLRNFWKTEVQLSSYHLLPFIQLPFPCFSVFSPTIFVLSSFRFPVSPVLPHLHLFILPYFNVSAVVQCRKTYIRPLVSMSHPGPFTTCCSVGLISFSACSLNPVSEGCHSQLVRFI